jgi:hypothetical protein
MKAKKTRIAAFLGGSALAALLGVPSATNATIHEIVAAYCSGGGHGAIEASGFLEPRGVSDPTKRNFAQPVVSNGAAVVLQGPPNVLAVIGDSPAAKFPEGTIIVDVANATFLQVSQANHPSAENCRNLRG